MFTGIIQEIGTITDIQEKNSIKTFSIKAAQTAVLLKIGDSVSIDGTCLTITTIKQDIFQVEAIPETLKLTISGEYKNGSQINLEPAMQLSDRLHGHLVSGHVDFIGTVISKKNEGDSTILTIDYPKNMNKFFNLKGSVTMNGVSLTISKVTGNSFEVSLIPRTLSNTNLKTLTEKSSVNIEIDLIARYLDGLLNANRQERSECP